LKVHLHNRTGCASKETLDESMLETINGLSMSHLKEMYLIIKKFISVFNRKEGKRSLLKTTEWRQELRNISGRGK
jgi:hypothetical protein